MGLILPKSPKSGRCPQYHERRTSQRRFILPDGESSTGTVRTRNLQPPASASPSTGDRNPTRTQGVNKKAFLCPICRKDFCKSFPLQRHLMTVHTITTPCYCDVEGCTYTKGFNRPDARIRHINNQHGSAKVTCPSCNKPIRKDGLDEHMSTKSCRAETADLLAGNARPSGPDAQSLGYSFPYIETESDSEPIFLEFSEDLSVATQARDKAAEEQTTWAKRVVTFSLSDQNMQYPLFQRNERFVSLQELMNERLHSSCEKGDAKWAYFYLSLIRHTGLIVAFADAFTTAISYGHLETARIILDEVKSDIDTDENQTIQRCCCDSHRRAAEQYDMLCNYCDRYQHAAEQDEMLCKLNFPYDTRLISDVFDKPSIQEAGSVDDPQTRRIISESAVVVKGILDTGHPLNWDGTFGEKTLLGIDSRAASRNGEIFQHLLHAGAQIAATGRHGWSLFPPEECDREHIRTVSQFVSLAASLDSDATELILNTGASLYRIQQKSAHANGLEHMDLLDISNDDPLSATRSGSSDEGWFEDWIG